MRWFLKPDPTLIWNIPRDEAKPGVLARALRVVGSLSLLGFSCLYYHWATLEPLPAPGQAVLIIGVTAALMALDMKNPLKAASVALIFALAFLENKSINDDRYRANLREASLWRVANTAADAATQTQAIVVSLSLQIDQLGPLIRNAERSHDTALVARLQREKEAAQKQLLLTMVPGISRQLWDVGNAWYAEEDHIQTRGMGGKVKPEEMARQEAQLAKSYLDSAKSLITSADYLRQQLLRQLPSDQSAEDASEGAIFSEALAGKRITPMELRETSTYLRNLSKRVAQAP
jgi:hypothetical protein